MSILAYLRETAAEYGIDRHITYHAKVTAADWSDAEARWTVTVRAHGDRRTVHGPLPLAVLRGRLLPL